MASLIYRCPFTASNVQGWVAEDATSRDVFVGLECPACKRTHMVNPATGRVLGAPDKPVE
jgi:hypothetical protein